MMKRKKSTVEIPSSSCTITKQDVREWVKAIINSKPNKIKMKKDYRGPGDKKDSPRMKNRPMTPPAALNQNPMAPEKAKRKYTSKKMK